MKLFNEESWRFIAKALRLIGGVGGLVDWFFYLLLIAYYSLTRPHVPQPDRNWTVQFRWSFSHPSYGTASENAFLMCLFFSFFIFLIIFLTSELIKSKLGDK